MAVTMRPFADLTRLLAPRSIAVIGASDHPGNLGGVAIRLLKKFGYPGDIWPINPRHAEVLGLPCRTSVAALPAPADLALFATGADSIPALVRECVAAGIRGGVVWAGGFSEVGARGAQLQRDLVAACAETGFALAGPNCIGIIDSWQSMTASFASFLTETDVLIRGHVSMVSQSGGLATMAQALAQRAGFGFRYTVSSGNEAVLTAADYIHAFVADPYTKVIAAYLEGVRDGARLVAALREARAAQKPVIVLKGGETAAAARAAIAHTGALAGEARVWEAVLREAGAIHVRSLEALLDHALFLSSTDPRTWPKGDAMAAVTFGGGGGVLAADQAARCGLTMPLLAQATRERLRGLVPPIASVDNPIDLTPQVFNRAEWFAHFAATLDAVAADPGVDSILLQFGPMAQRGMEVAREACAFRRRTDKTVCFAWPLAPRGIPEFLSGEGVHAFGEYARAIAVLGSLARRKAALAAVPDEMEADEVTRLASLRWPEAKARAGARPTVIAEPECHRLLAEAGLAVAGARLTHSEEEAIAALREIGAPVAMKAISPAVSHRASAGLLALGVAAEREARDAYRQLTAKAGAAAIALDGVYVQQMISGGIEVLVSILRDPVFGPIVSCGAGGSLTELIDDVALARAPVGATQALAMIDRLRIACAAARMKPQPDRMQLAAYIARLSQLAVIAPWRAFVLEANPVKWRHDGVVAVDGLLVVEDARAVDEAPA